VEARATSKLQNKMPKKQRLDWRRRMMASESLVALSIGERLWRKVEIKRRGAGAGAGALAGAAFIYNMRSRKGVMGLHKAIR